MSLRLREVQEADNPTLASVIRESLTEFGCNIPGTVFTDPETDRIAQQFTLPKTIYFVAEWNGEVVGGAGINILAGEVDTCELQKLYLHRSARGKGIATELMKLCIAFAKSVGYKAIYLETKKELHVAVPLYEKFGFQHIDHPMGNTGHFSCEIKMLKSL